MKALLQFLLGTEKESKTCKLTPEQLKDCRGKVEKLVEKYEVTANYLTQFSKLPDPKSVSSLLEFCEQKKILNQKIIIRLINKDYNYAASFLMLMQQINLQITPQLLYLYCLFQYDNAQVIKEIFIKLEGQSLNLPENYEFVLQNEEFANIINQKLSMDYILGLPPKMNYLFQDIKDTLKQREQSLITLFSSNIRLPQPVRETIINYFLPA